MKHILIALLLVIVVVNTTPLLAQSTMKTTSLDKDVITATFKWSNPDYFASAPKPLVYRFGPLSDSLAQAHSGYQFYFSGVKYFGVNTWADYYLWYTQTFPDLFESPHLYEHYWATGNDWEMANYIVRSTYNNGQHHSFNLLDRENRIFPMAGTFSMNQPISYQNPDQINSLNKPLSMNDTGSSKPSASGSALVVNKPRDTSSNK